MVHKFYYYIITAGLVLTLILGGIIWWQENNKGLEVIFLDVGQGDAILVQQGNNQLLIDGGKSGKVLLEKLGSYVPFWDRQIEAVVATHPDQDHIGGLVDLLKSYKTSDIIKTKAGSESQTYKALTEEIKKNDAETIEAKQGVNFRFPNGAVAEVIFPVASIEAGASADSNAGSVVLRLNYGESSFLFAGDLPSGQEDSLDAAGIDFLKVSHHGSKYSTSADFLEKINPREAIVSVGKNNRYGHPNQEVLDRLSKRGIKIWRTDEMGDITYGCNPPAGEQILKCKIIFQ